MRKQARLRAKACEDPHCLNQNFQDKGISRINVAPHFEAARPEREAKGLVSESA